MSTTLSEQEIIRRESLQQLRELGINPYPAEAYNVTAFAKDILDNFNLWGKVYNPSLGRTGVVTRNSGQNGT